MITKRGLGAERSPGEARLIFDAASFRMVERGSFVKCAVTGKPIPITHLKYWSVERQEPYFDAVASLEAETRARDSRATGADNDNLADPS
ncbi:MAG: DUF2093 domain-containing protein [Pseudomonadota bacterium]